MQKSHTDKVRAVQDQVRAFYKSGTKVKIYHGSTNSLRKQNFNASNIVDISNLNNVLNVDVKNRVAVAEPNVSMRKLVKETLKYGLIPAVVMEFPGITVGGGIQGAAAESSAFKYGGFHDTCSEYEIVLSNGRIITASRENYSELYSEVPCSFGTLGIITKAKIKLIPAKKYVSLRYIKVRSFSEARKESFKRFKKIDYVDGIMFSKNSGVVMVGKLTNKSRLKVCRFSRFIDDWFYLHAKKVIDKQDYYDELIPIEDYLFRYDRGAFWMGRYAYKFLHIPFNRITRAIFNPFTTTEFLYRQLHAANMSQRYVVQDLCMPKDTVVSFLKFVDANMGCYPLWLLPINAKVSTKSNFSPVYSKSSSKLLNVGVWTETKDYSLFLEQNKLIEQIVKDLGGRKTLYAHTYYSRREFWDIYDKNVYDKIRSKYSADVIFPDIYSKVAVRERYKPSIARAAVRLTNIKLPVSNTQT